MATQEIQAAQLKQGAKELHTTKAKQPWYGKIISGAWIVGWILYLSFALLVYYLVITPLCFILRLDSKNFIVYPWAAVIFSHLNRFIEWWCGIRTVYWYDDKPVPPRENAIFVCNHRDYIDFTVTYGLSCRKGRSQFARVMLKDWLKWVPIVGHCLKFVGVIYMKRNWLADASTLRKNFDEIINGNDPFWIQIFPEGTLMEPEKLKLAQEFSRSRNLPVLNNVLVPKVKGFCAILQEKGLRDKLDALYDCTLGYPSREKPTSFFKYMAGNQPPLELNLYIKRYPISEIPTEEKALGDWLTNRFIEKDALLEKFYATGQFPGKRVYEPLVPREPYGVDVLRWLPPLSFLNPKRQNKQKQQ